MREEGEQRRAAKLYDLIEEVCRHTMLLHSVDFETATLDEPVARTQYHTIRLTSAVVLLLSYELSSALVLCVALLVAIL